MNYVYMLRCADGTLYTGWTNDLTRRLDAHNSGKGAKYTRGRGPATLAFSQIFDTPAEARGYEAAIKKLSVKEKEALIASLYEENDELLTVYDAALRPCGGYPRRLVHAQGLRHMVAHLWLIADGRLWLQQRAFDRPLYPSMFDQAATGHISHGESPALAVCREAREEPGIEVTPEQLAFIGTVDQRFPRPNGFDDEVVHIFLCRLEHTPTFRPGGEVARMAAVPIEEYARAEAAYAEGHPAEVALEDGERLPLDRFCCWHAEEWGLVRAWLEKNPAS